MEFVYLIISLAIIVKAADFVVDGASSLAIRCRIPKIIIALTIVSFGTCTPELAISFNSIASNNGSIALANIIGSCIVNIALILGIAALVKPIKVNNSSIKKELPILLIITMFFSTILLFRIFNGEEINSFQGIDGIILVGLFLIFVIYIINIIINRDKSIDNNQDNPQYGMFKSIIYLIIGIITITFCSDILVDNAVIIAQKLGITQKVITMVVIVIGTSLPELVMTVTAAKKKEGELAVGNIIGTNIFNICIVLGLPITIFGGFDIVGFNIIDVLALLIVVVMLFKFAKSGNDLTKKEGLALVIIFIAYYGYMIFF